MKKKGFTLIELLAVIVILAIITLIATPIILGVIEKAKISSAENSVLGYVDALEKTIIMEITKGNNIEDGNYHTNDGSNLTSNVKYKGSNVTGTFTLTKKQILNGTFCVNKYSIDYNGNKAIYNKNANFCNGEMVEVDPTDGSCPIVHKPSPRYTNEELLQACSVSNKPTGDILFCEQNNIDSTNESDFVFDSEIGTIQYYSGSDDEVVIPCTIAGIKVNNIGGGVLSGSNLKKIVLNDNIKTIGDGAFSGTLLSEVYIPDSVNTIGTGSFSGNPLRIISLGQGIKSLNMQSFRSTAVIEHFYFDGDNLEIPDGLFSNLDNIDKITFGNGIISVGENSFSSSDIKRIEFGSNLKTIKNNAFEGNTLLTSICFPKNIDTIGHNSFQNNSNLENLFFQEGVHTINSFAFSGNKISYLYLPNSLTNMGSYVFDENPLDTIIMGNGIVDLDFATTHTFDSTTPIKYAYVDGNNAYVYGISLFKDSPSIEHLAFGDGITKIQAFDNRSIKILELNNNTSQIVDTAFRNNNITKICIPNKLTVLEPNVFSENSINKLTIPKGIVSIENNAFRSNLITEIKFGDNINKISSSSFEKNLIEKITIPKNINTLEVGALYDNPELKEIINDPKLNIDWSKILNRDVPGGCTFIEGVCDGVSIKISE